MSTSQSHTNIHLIQNLSNIHIFLVFETCNSLVCHKEALFWVLMEHIFALAQHNYSSSLQNHKDSHLIQILSKCHILTSTSKKTILLVFSISLNIYIYLYNPFFTLDSKVDIWHIFLIWRNEKRGKFF